MKATVWLTLLSFAAEATPPRLPFEDLGHAYALGQVTEARALARRYLDATAARIRNAGTDSNRWIATIDSLRLAMIVLGGEGRYSVLGRFRNSLDLLAKVEDAMATAKSVQPSSEWRESFDAAMGGAGHYWLAATYGIRTEMDVR